MMRIPILISLIALCTALYPSAAQQSIGRRVYVSDTGNHRIVRLDGMDGSGWTAFGAKGAGVGQFNSPVGISVDDRGRIHVADAMNARVVRFDDMKGSRWTVFHTVPEQASKEHFDGPALCGLMVAPGGSVYTANGLFGQVSLIPDLAGKRIRSYRPHDPRTLVFASGIAHDRSGRLYVADRGGNVVRMDNIDGKGWVSYFHQGHGKGQFDSPAGICLDGRGRIYAADLGNCRIVRMDTIAGKGWTSFGTKGSGRGQFDGPAGICLDSLGRIYVADSGNNRIVRIDDMTGKRWTTFGAEGNGAGQFSNPLGICIK